nr:adenylate/guanylate cyclase domain-containing protein [uncultured Duganella sp.]
MAAWPGLRRVLQAIAVALVCYALSLSAPLVRLQLAATDQAFAALRAWRPAPSAETSPVIIVGVDAASISASGKPLALMLDEFADLLDGLGSGQARAVGIDLMFPNQSYEQLQPGASRRLALAIARLRSQAPLVLGLAGAQAAGGDAGPLYAAMAGADGLASLQVPLDRDGRLRRIEVTTAMRAAGLEPLSLRLARQLGVPARTGMVDYAQGAPYAYLPLHRVVALARAHDQRELQRLFAGKVVLVGAVLPDVDRQQLALPLAQWEQAGSSAGVVFQAQAVRSLLTQRMIAPQPWLEALAAVAAALICWPLRRRAAVATVTALSLAVLAAAASIGLLHRGWHASPLAAWLALAVCVGAAWWQAFCHHRAEQRRVKEIFAGYVSPAILDTILSGALRAGGGQRAPLAFLFADIRGFTAFCAGHPPEQVIAFLNRYYAAITVPLHRHGGTIDKFSGDGIMVFFGAPLPSDNPCRDALLAAVGMFEALAQLNRELAAEGTAPVRIGVGIAYGDAVLGNVGSAQRHDYTATGASTTLAAHIQQHCKEVPHDLLIERGAFERAAPAAALAAQFEFLHVGLKKHGYVELAAYLAPAVPAAVAVAVA